MNKLITILFLGDTVCYKDLEHEEISFKITEGYDSIFHKISKILKSNFFNYIFSPKIAIGIPVFLDSKIKDLIKLKMSGFLFRYTIYYFDISLVITENIILKEFLNIYEFDSRYNLTYLNRSQIVKDEIIMNNISSDSVRINDFLKIMTEKDIFYFSNSLDKKIINEFKIKEIKLNLLI